MNNDRRKLPDSVRAHLIGLGYRYLGEEHPDSGGIVIYLQREAGEEEAAYYISKPSTIELVTSDELRQILDLLEQEGVRLQHVVTGSPFSAGSHKLAGESGITLWEMRARYVEAARPIADITRLKHLMFRLGVMFVRSAGQFR